MRMEDILMLLGGLALFLYGMQMMSNGLETAAGNKMKSILEKLTSNRIKGVVVGSNLAEARSLAGEHIDIVHREARLSFLRDGEQVENRIGGTTHCNIQ